MKKIHKLLILITLILSFTLLFSAITSEEKMVRIGIISIANNCLGIQYKYNGSTPEGFDNAGFVMYVYYKNRIKLPRDILEQYKMGNSVSVKAARPGDLLFFSHNTKDKSVINHVGIYLGKDKFVHMPGEGSFVEIERLKKGSVYSKEFIGVVSYKHHYKYEIDKSKKNEEKDGSSQNTATKYNKSAGAETTFSSEDL